MILEATQSVSAPSRVPAPGGVMAGAIVIPLHARRLDRIALREAVRIGAVFAVCLLGLMSSLADTAVARSSFLLIDTPGDGAGLDSVAAALAWATVADIAVCVGIVLIGYCLLARPSAEIVPLHPRRYNRKL